VALLLRAESLQALVATFADERNSEAAVGQGGGKPIDSSEYPWRIDIEFME